ncbi:MAG: GntR family transcriptional regulator [Eubacterium sp.]|nr:putative uncharacterized protein [Clostridium sp. CAG:167]
MYISIDFDSNEALYIQLRNQIILAIVRQDLTQGQNLPSVRDMAEQIGINMHTVNKAYSVLRQEGYVQLDHRKGAMVSVDMDKVKAMVELDETLQLVLARAMCKQVNREEVHELVDQIYDQYEECRRK